MNCSNEADLENSKNNLTSKSKKIIQQEEHNILDKIIENASISWEHYKILCYLIIYLTADGFVIIGNSLLVPAISTPMMLTEFQKGIVGGSIFIGFTIGAISSGLISDTQGRKMSFYLGNFLSLVGATCGYFYCIKIEGIVLGNIIIGLGIGINVPAMMSLVCEITPTRPRYIIMGCIWIVFVFGEIFGCIIAMKYEIYQYENKNWNLLLFYRIIWVRYIIIILKLYFWSKKIL